MTTIGREKMDVEAVEAAAKRFVENYYRTFEENRADLVNLYQEDSVLFYDDQKIEGKEAIMAKLLSLPFPKHHHIDTINCLPDNGDGDITIVHVTGGIQPEGKLNALAFIQVFHLIPTPRESFRVEVEFFRMKFSLPKGSQGHLVFTPFSSRTRAIPFVQKF